MDLLDEPHTDATLVQKIQRKVTKTFKGKVHIPNDLGRIVITKAAIKTQKFNEATGNWA